MKYSAIQGIPEPLVVGQGLPALVPFIASPVRSEEPPRVCVWSRLGDVPALPLQLCGPWIGSDASQGPTHPGRGLPCAWESFEEPIL